MRTVRRFSACSALIGQDFGQESAPAEKSPASGRKPAKDRSVLNSHLPIVHRPITPESSPCSSRLILVDATYPSVDSNLATKGVQYLPAQMGPALRHCVEATGSQDARYGAQDGFSAFCGWSDGFPQAPATKAASSASFNLWALSSSFPPRSSSRPCA